MTPAPKNPIFNLEGLGNAWNGRNGSGDYILSRKRLPFRPGRVKPHHPLGHSLTPRGIVYEPLHELIGILSKVTDGTGKVLCCEGGVFRRILICCCFVKEVAVAALFC